MENAMKKWGRRKAGCWGRVRGSKWKKRQAAKAVRRAMMKEAA